MVPATLNGQPGFLLYTDSGLLSAWLLDIVDGRIHAVRAVLNPDKLRHIGGAR
jgi:RNA polymerase sigma-70 factor (ECF subfamily)